MNRELLLMKQHDDQRIGTSVERATAILQSGGLVGIPTETVYGLGADAHNTSAVASIFTVKGRPADHPLIVHVPDLASAQKWAAEWPISAEALARNFWPGPLTIIVTKSPTAPDTVTGGRSSVALRIPSHPLALQLLEFFPGGIAAPSANRFGKVSPTTARHVLADLDKDVDYILDGGPCDVGVESTIVDCTVSPPQVLRFGSITPEQITSVIGPLAPATGPARASGMLDSHYAPRCHVHPTSSLEEATLLVNQLSTKTRVLNGSLNPQQFAHDLYALLRLADDDGVDDVVIVLPDDDDIGRAIRDRVFKAAADHSNDHIS